MADQRLPARIWLVRIAKFALVAILSSSLAYWSFWSPVEVIQRRAERGSIVEEVMGTGTLEARVKANISAKISGRIDEILVDQGDTAKSGQLLLQLGDEELRQQVEIARADLAASEAAIVRLETDMQRTTAILTQTHQHYERTTKLRQSNAASQSDLDAASEAMAVAQAGLANAQAAVAEGRTKRVTAEKTLRFQQARLADARISAPFDGLIVARKRDPGDVIVPGSAALTLISLDELWISAWVDETEMAKLAPGQPARVVFRSEPDRSYPGKVSRLGRETDRETREFVVDISVLDLPVNWAVGQRAEVYITTSHSDSAVLIPPSFVVWRDEQDPTGGIARAPGVYVTESERSHWRPIKLGLRSRDAVEILEGVSEGDRLIIPQRNAKPLAEGKRITLK